MAGITARRAPLSLQELVYFTSDLDKELDKRLDTLEQKKLAVANALAGKLGRPVDAALKDKYERYLSIIDEQTDKMMRLGLSANDMRVIRLANTAYAEHIKPIEEAYTNWLKLMDTQLRELQQQGSNYARSNINASTVGLQSFIDNPGLLAEYKRVNGLEVAQLVALNFKYMAEMSQEEFNLFIDKGYTKSMSRMPGDNYHKIFTQHTGLSPKIIRAYLNGDLEGMKGKLGELNQMFNEAIARELQMAGATKENGFSDLDILDLGNIAKKGINATIGKETQQVIEDLDAKAALELRTYAAKKAIEDEYARKAEARAAARAKEKEKEERLQFIRNNTSPVSFEREFTEEEKRANNYAKDLFGDKKYFKKNPYYKEGTNTQLYVLTEYAKNLLKRAGESRTVSDASLWNVIGLKSKDQQFIEWMFLLDPLLGPKNKDPKTGKISTSLINFNTNLDALPALAEMQHNEVKAGSLSARGDVAMLRIPIGTEDSKTIVNKIGATGALEIMQAGKLRKDGTVAPSKTVSMEDFRIKVLGKTGADKQDPNPITYIENNAVGNQQYITLSNGERYILPSTIWGEELKNTKGGLGDLDKANIGIVMSPPRSDAQLMNAVTASQYLETLIHTANNPNINRGGQWSNADIMVTPEGYTYPGLAQ